MAYQQENPAKQRSIQFQSANNGAANIVSGMAAGGLVTSDLHDVLAVFDQVRDHIFEATVTDGGGSVAPAAPAAAPAAKKSYPKKAAPEAQAPTGFTGAPTDTLACFTRKDEAGNLVPRYKGPGGKFANMELQDIYADEQGPNFLSFITERNNPPAELVAGVQKFLASR